jgi:hypothetical protein
MRQNVMILPGLLNGLSHYLTCIPSVGLSVNSLVPRSVRQLPFQGIMDGHNTDSPGGVLLQGFNHFPGIRRRDDDKIDALLLQTVFNKIRLVQTGFNGLG